MKIFHMFRDWYDKDTQYDENDIFLRTFGVPVKKVEEYTNEVFCECNIRSLPLLFDRKDINECPLNRLSYISLWGFPVGLDGTAYSSIKKMCSAYGIESQLYSKRRSQGKSHREALTVPCKKRDGTIKVNGFEDVKKAFALNDGRLYYYATCKTCGLKDVFTLDEMGLHLKEQHNKDVFQSLSTEKVDTYKNT